MNNEEMRCRVDMKQKGEQLSGLNDSDEFLTCEAYEEGAAD